MKIQSYSVTTVASRFNDLLPATLASLTEAGFANPLVCVDGQEKHSDQSFSHPKLDTAKNWYLAAVMLYLSSPNSPAYAIFQDDIVCCKNLKQYLEQCNHPLEKGYLNLYTGPVNQSQGTGWTPSKRRGEGALALVFSNETLRKLLSTRRFVDRPKDAAKGHKSIDGGIADALNLDHGITEYVHQPSLVQHAGHGLSSMGNRPRPLCTNFAGATFDALTLL